MQLEVQGIERMHAAYNSFPLSSTLSARQTFTTIHIINHDAIDRIGTVSHSVTHLWCMLHCR